jgi:Na+/proline symporter
VDYVVEKRNNAFEVLVSSVLLFLMLKQLAENIKDLAKDTATALGIGTSSLTGGIGAAVFAGLSIAVQLAYNIAILSATLNLGKDLINALAPPKRTHKAINFKRALEVIAGRLGYTLNTDISFLDNVYYLPSNSTPDEFNNKGFIKKAGTITKGIPKSNDVGYNCNAFFGLVAKLVNGTWGIESDSLILRNKESDFGARKQAIQCPVFYPLLTNTIPMN